MSESDNLTGQDLDASKAGAQSLLASLSSLVTAALIWGVIAFVVEGAWIANSTPNAPAWAMWLNLGAAAPLVLGVSALLPLLMLSWRNLLPSFEVRAWLPRVKQWLTSGEPDALASRSAALLGAPLLAVTWLTIGIKAGTRIQSAIQTPFFVSALFILVLALSSFGLALLSPLLFAPTRYALARIARLHPWLARLTRPDTLLYAFFGASLVLIFLASRRYSDVLEVLPWGYVLGPLAGFCAAAPAFWILKRRPVARNLSLGVLLCCVVGEGIFVFFLPPSWSELRTILFDQPSYASHWIEWIEPKLDSDKDGLSSYFGGGDCAPDDPTIAPNQLDFIDNGIDEDCDGADLSVDVSSFSLGKNTHPRPEGLSKRPHVILITTDALSFNHTSLGGYHRDTTPKLKAWSERATVFDAAFSISPGTRLAWPALAAGVMNSQMPMKKTRKYPFSWSPDFPTLASILKANGYDTVHIPGGSYFNKKTWNYMGGFDTIHYAWKGAKDKGHTAPEVTQLALTEVLEARDSPLFLWVHYFDHHGPFNLPGSLSTFKGKDLQTRYDNEVRYADEWWAKLIEAAEAQWGDEEYLIIFTSDHGEAFDDNHKKHHHGYELHTADLHVPLIIQASSGRGRRVSGLVSHLDIVPTLANLIGAPPLDDWLGESLLPVIFENKDVEKTLVLGLFYIPEDTLHKKDPFQKISLRGDTFYFSTHLRKNIHTLTRWREDPLETNNLLDRERNIFLTYRYLVLERLMWLREHERGLTHQ